MPKGSVCLRSGPAFYMNKDVMTEEQKKTNDVFPPNVMLVDADYADRMCSGLRGFLHEQLQRELPDGDLASWLVCCALDGGIRPDGSPVQVVFVASGKDKALSAFQPRNLAEDVDGKAFADAQMGEFLMSVVQEETLNSGEPLFVQCAASVLESSKEGCLVLVADMPRYGEALTPVLRAAEGRQVTLLTMHPDKENGLPQVLLGYSLMHAMGVSAEELDRQTE